MTDTYDETWYVESPFFPRGKRWPSAPDTRIRYDRRFRMGNYETSHNPGNPDNVAEVRTTRGRMLFLPTQVHDESKGIVRIRVYPTPPHSRAF